MTQIRDAMIHVGWCMEVWISRNPHFAFFLLFDSDVDVMIADSFLSPVSKVPE